jgi:hypothetical protein
LSWIPAEDSEKLLGVQVLILKTGRNAASSLLEWSWQTVKAQMDPHQSLQGELGTGLKEREREMVYWKRQKRLVPRNIFRALNAKQSCWKLQPSLPLLRASLKSKLSK